MAEILADDTSLDDRRRVVGAGVRHGRDVLIADMRATADHVVTNVTSSVIAIRGERLVLRRIRYSGQDQRPEPFHTEILSIVEIDADERTTARVLFDLDDLDAAFEELDARYLAGEAAAHAQTWSVLAHANEALKRRELPATTPDYVIVDHRPVATIEAGNVAAGLDAGWDLTPDASIYIEAVHRLTDLGAVVTWAANGTSQEGFDAEWRVISLGTVVGDLINRCELFDETDLDAALARFDELSRSAQRLENTASQAYERAQAYIAARNWIAVAETLTEDLRVNDRRPVVGAGVRHGRDEAIADMRTTADLGITKVTSAVIATRGERLMLVRSRHTRPDQGSGAFHTEVLGLYETNADDRIAAVDVFGFDELDAAFEELDRRYLAGEAAAHSHTWILMAEAFAALNRHELPETTPDYVIVDHQLQHTTIEASGLTEYLRAQWDLTPDLRMYIEAVHRLTDLGAVVTLAVRGTSTEGFDADWRSVELLTREGDVGKRCELFNEDLDAALARFDELSRPVARLENTASRVHERLNAYFAARDWAAITDILAADLVTEDRRPVVNAGMRHGRDAHIAELRSIAEVGIDNITWTAIATRGELLTLSHAHLPAFQTDVLTLVEIDADNRIAAYVAFDFDDIDAAFEELDERYLVGEAAAHSRTWSVIMRSFAAIKGRELPTTVPDFVDIDRRRTANIDAGGMKAFLRTALDLTPEFTSYVETVHRLSDLGAVVTQVVHGKSQDGFEAEWRVIDVFTVEGELLSRCEAFDEVDLDVALARLDELSRQAPRLENDASRVDDRFKNYFAARDWDAMTEILAEEFSIDDRRRVVNIGIRNGPDVEIANMRAAAEVGAKAMTFVVIATRGKRLALSRIRAWGPDQRPEAFHTDALGIVEINADNRIAARVAFDLDDIDAAFEELDARYLAGEAAPYAQTWSVIAGAYAAFNRHELFATTPDWANIDHRRGIGFAPGDMIPYIRASWDVTPDLIINIEAVHRLSDVGAVVTHATQGTSQEGFDAEWRVISLLTVKGDLINRCERFDEADVDAALARFDELSRPAPRLENSATRVTERFQASLTAHDWDAIAAIMADDISNDDRRRVVNAGIRRGPEAEIDNMRAVADLGATVTTSDVIATRGERLALLRMRVSIRDQDASAFDVESLNIVEIDTDDRIVAIVTFRP